MIPTFKLEEYLSRYEFKAPYLLCCSDAQSFTMADILAMASPQDKALWDNLYLSYTEDRGLPALRSTIASGLYEGLTADNILCFSGAQEGIAAALTALLESSDHAIVITPCYQSLFEIPKHIGCEVTELPLRESDMWRLDVKAIASQIRPNTKALVINFPHNPTGQVLDEATLKKVISLCEAHNLWLFSDEVYRLMGSPDKPWAPPAACIYKRALSLGVMSKAFGLAGLRIGWVACQDEELLTRIKCAKHYSTICSSAPSEILSLIALKNKETILTRNNQIVANNLKLLDVFFQEYSHLFSWVRPQGGCTGFVRYHGQGSVEHFCSQLVENEGILLLPSNVYCLDTPHFRIGFGRTNMPEALQKLKKTLG